MQWDELKSLPLTLVDRMRLWNSAMISDYVIERTSSVIPCIFITITGSQFITSLWPSFSSFKRKEVDFNHLQGKRVFHVLFNFICIRPKCYLYSCYMYYHIFCLVSQEPSHLQGLKGRLLHTLIYINKNITHLWLITHHVLCS